ncbi:MAG: Gfo/Idh/MocA family protein [Spirochaetales bacterium]
MPRLRWGILAPGAIAHKFAKGLEGLPDAELVAVGSRSIDRAREFADQYRVPNAHGSYEELARDPEVDAIYVATPHNYHRDAAILCLDSGKAVLCEKPLAANAAQAKEMVSAARRNDVFFMEAMWTRFLPAWQQVRAWIRAGEVGDVRLVNGTFAFRTGWDPESRLLNPDLAGGGLLDVGIYLVSAAYWVTGHAPEEVIGRAHIGETGVDEQAAFILEYADGSLAMLGCGVRTNAQHVFTVYGTEGWIEVPHMFWGTTSAILHRGETETRFEEPHLSNGYEYEAREVAECVAAGKSESDILPLDESLRIMETLDRIRAQWGLVYPFER